MLLLGGGTRRGIMGRVRTIVGWAIGLGLFATLITVVIPHISDNRCKARWEPLGLQAEWVFETGCMVRFGQRLVREEYVSFSRAAPTPRK
jgi:hypothetical protein